MDIQTDGLVTKQMKFFQMVQSNTEFLTVLRRSIDQQSGNHLPTLQEYQANMGSIKINAENFIQNFIQVAYLIFTCKYYNLIPQINSKDLRIQESPYLLSDKRFSIIIYYRFLVKVQGNSTITNYTSIVHQLFTYLLKFYHHLCELQLFPAEYKNTLNIFIKQYDLLTTTLSSLTNSNTNEQQRQYFICLEQCSIFRQYSILLQIKKNSILDIMKNHINQFREFKKRDQEQVKNYHKEKNKIKTRNYQELKRIEKKIQGNIIKFFEFVTENNKERSVMAVEEDFNGKLKIIFEIEDMPDEPYLLRMKRVSNYLNNINLEIQKQQNVPLKQKNYGKYHIEYSSERNSICVRLIFSLNVINYETADLLMFQSNALTFDTANVSIEVLEAKPTQINTPNIKSPNTINSVRKQRYLAFKATSCFNDKQAPLQKILLLMDLTMISSKIYQPYLNMQKSPLNLALDYQKLSIVYNRVNHYTRIFLKCAKKVLQNIPLKQKIYLG